MTIPDLLHESFCRNARVNDTLLQALTPADLDARSKGGGWSLGQHLCIIPGGKSEGPALDFDGDRVLSLILSKAFLLADDIKITDPVILQQLGR